MPASDPTEEAKRWLAFAEDDLALAKEIVTMGNVRPGQACYHAQQAGEKALKAVLILAGIPVPRTHDLVLLGSLVPSPWTTHMAAPDLFDLGNWAVSARYPDAGGAVEATLADAQAAIGLAEILVSGAQTDLVDHG